MLCKRATHTSGLFWPQRNMAAALIDEVIHLFGNYIGCVSEPLKDA
jgi:hypothetical protein